MNGREDQNANHLFFLCSLIEYISRKTKNHRNVIVNAIGKKDLQHIFDLADIYHCENMDKLVFEFTEKHNIENGIFDNVANARYSIPTHWDIGKVYKRLIIAVSKKENKSLMAAFITKVLNIFFSHIWQAKTYNFFYLIHFPLCLIMHGHSFHPSFYLRSL
jgi:hypothetical protein